jgi:hypothetical protein
MTQDDLLKIILDHYSNSLILKSKAVCDLKIIGFVPEKVLKGINPTGYHTPFLQSNHTK